MELGQLVSTCLWLFAPNSVGVVALSWSWSPECSDCFGLSWNIGCPGDTASPRMSPLGMLQIEHIPPLEESMAPLAKGTYFLEGGMLLVVGMPLVGGMNTSFPDSIAHLGHRDRLGSDFRGRSGDFATRLQLFPG